MRQLWDRYVLPHLIRKACASSPTTRQRQKVVPLATGRVLEVGVGSGFNLSHYDPEVVRAVVGVDPSTALLADAHAAAREVEFDVDLVVGVAEQLPGDAASFDTVVVTYTLCTIPDLDAALAEVRRVLKPEGRLIFSEHGQAPDPGVRRIQDALTPFWRRVGGGCRLNRPIERLLLEAGFSFESVDSRYLPGPRWLNFHSWGVARP